MRQVTLGHLLGVVLVALTLVLAAIAGIAIIRIDDHRQDYEAEVAAAYRLEAAGWRLAAGEGSGPAFQAEADRVAALARDDQESAALAARLRQDAGSEAGLQAAAALANRQGVRRAGARQDLDDRDASTLLAAAAAGAVALVLAIAVVVLIAVRMREPVEELADAARALVGGRARGRGGPAELRALAAALGSFGAEARPPPQLAPPAEGDVAGSIEAFGRPLVLCDADGRVTHVNSRARDLFPDLKAGVSIAEPDHDAPPLAGRAELTLAGRTLGVSVGFPEEGAEAVWVVRDLGPAVAP